MKNLKKIICLILSFAMILGLFSVAYASEETKYQEAVDVLKALKLVEGEPDGTFDFDAVLTREAAAKLIACLICGSENVDAIKCEQIFSDLAADYWSAKYVMVCYNENVIHGFDDGSFHPSEEVTGYQFGKILVCCLGYDMEKEEISGPSWDARIAALMYASGIMEGLDLDLSVSLTRDDAFKMLFNALKATVIEYTEDGNIVPAENNAETETIFNDNILQLGEKYCLQLKLAEENKTHKWFINDLEIGQYDGIYEHASESEAAEDLSNLHVLFGFKQLVLNERVLEALSFNKNNNVANKKTAITNVLSAMAAEAEENTVLFSKEAAGFYSPVLFAEPGEEIYVMANWISAERIKKIVDFAEDAIDLITNDTAPKSVYNPGTSHIPTKLKSLTSAEFDAKNLVDGSIAAALWSKYANNENVSVGLLQYLFAEKAMDIAKEFVRYGLVNALEEQGLGTIELEEVSPAIGKVPAVYKFVMPDRMVTGFDFVQVEPNIITFTLNSALKTGHGAALLLVQTDEFSVPSLKIINGNSDVTVSVEEGQTVSFTIIPFNFGGYYFWTPSITSGSGNLANIVEAHRLDAFVSNTIKKAVPHMGYLTPKEDEAYLAYSLYGYHSDVTITLGGSGKK